MEIQLSEHFTYRKLFKFVMPSIIMMIFTSVYGVVDGIFVSNYVGKTPFAAVNLIMPFLMALGTVGFMLGTGGSAYVSAVLGTGKKKESDRYFTMIVLVGIMVGIVISIIGFIFIRPIAGAMGANEILIEDCVTYGRILVIFITPFILQNIFQSFFVTAERPKLGLMMTVVAGCTNIFLDWLFVAVLEWGIEGAAIATGISQIIGGIIPLFYFLLINGI